MIRILLSGATGRIGRETERLTETGNAFSIAGRASSHGFFGAGDRGHVVIDFSCPELTARTLDFALEHRLPLVTGTTGLAPELQARVESAAQRIAVFQAANFSIGVHLLRELAAAAARRLGPEFSIEICETHHRHKVDAPSGTALLLGRALAEARGLDHDAAAVFDRSDRSSTRESSEIGYQSIRGGDVAGEHTVHLLGPGERLEMTHRASDRSLFARGALRAAAWLVDRPAGWYGMDELLGERM